MTGILGEGVRFTFQKGSSFWSVGKRAFPPSNPNPQIKNGMFFLHPWSSWWFFTNPFEKYAHQIGNLPQIWVKMKKYLKPAPSGFLNCHMAIQNWSFKKLSMEISALVVGRGSKSRGTLKNLLIYMSMAIVINTSKIVHLKTALSRINSLSQ